jgi:hypothetical protein
LHSFNYFSIIYIFIEPKKIVPITIKRDKSVLIPPVLNKGPNAAEEGGEGEENGGEVKKKKKKKKKHVE